MTIYLVPARRGRYELYSEVADGEQTAPPPEGRFRRWLHAANQQWHTLVTQARRAAGTSLWARTRDRVVCALAESIAEQRTLWALRAETDAEVCIPAFMDPADARRCVLQDMAVARSHHVRWLIVDTLLFIVSGVLAILPGPNLVAYYFAFRCVGHLQSWRGARQGMDVVRWTFSPDQALSELSELVDVPRASRAERVDAIAARLNLRHLADFFDRVAVPST